MVAGLIDRPPLSTDRDPCSTSTFGDLRGGRIGTSSLTEGTRHVAERMLAAHGLSYPADYDFALEGSHVERWKALQAGTIDAALQMIPYDDIATDAGFTDLGPVTEEFAFNAVCVRLPAERTSVTAFLAGSAEAARLVPRPHRGVGGDRRGPHLDRAALRAGGLPEAGRRRGHPAGPAVRPRRAGRDDRGAAVQRPDPADCYLELTGPARRRRRLLLPSDDRAPAARLS